MRSLVASGCFRSRRGPVSGEQSRALVGSPCRCYPAATGRDHDVIEKSRNRYYYSQQPLVYVRPVRDLPVAVLLLVLPWNRSRYRWELWPDRCTMYAMYGDPRNRYRRATDPQWVPVAIFFLAGEGVQVLAVSLRGLLGQVDGGARKDGDTQC